MVSSTCENPEKAVAFLNMLYTDSTLANLLSWGIEDRDYVLVEEGEEEGQGVITFPDGVDSSTAPCYIGSMVGDALYGYVMEPDILDFYADEEVYRAQFDESNSSIALGYSFDTSDYSAEITAIDSVIAEYTASISAGSTDPETTLTAFINALKDAGIDDVVAANNEQFQAWLADN